MANASVTVRGTPENPIFDFDIPQGEKGDVGGITYGSDLSSIHLDTILVPGMYRQSNGANTSPALGYPLTGNTCTLMVLASWNDTSRVTQTLETVASGTGATSRVFYKRTYYSGVWSPWRSFSSTRIDQTSGRAIYQWDDLNLREQLIYGDTGIRDVSSLMTYGASGTLFLSRYDSTVEFVMVNWNKAVVDPGDPRTILTLPLGFKPKTGLPANPIWQTNKNVDFIDISGSTGVVKTLVNPATGNYFTKLVWTTNDPWPTVLPGTASGSIPSS